MLGVPIGQASHFYLYQLFLRTVNMTKFLLRYHGGTHPSTPKESTQVMAAWRDWFASMGDAVIDSGNPVGRSCTINRDGSMTPNGGANPTAGYSIIQAENLEFAYNLARGCPTLQSGGSIEITDIIEVA